MSPEELRGACLEIIPDAEACDHFLSALNGDDLAALPHLGLVLVPPEAFALGAARDLASRIEASGFHPVGFGVTDRLTHAQISGMMLPCWSHKRYFIHRRFSAGPTAAILVTHPADAPAGDLLSAVKGHALRGVAGPDTWRGSLPVINGVLNLVHTADDPAQVIQSAIPFFTAEAFGRAVRTMRAARGCGIAPGSWNEIRALLAPRDRRAPGCRPFMSTYLRLLRRILGLPGAPAADPRVVRARRELRRAALLHEAPGPVDWRRAVQAVDAAVCCEPLCDATVRPLLRSFTNFQDVRMVDWRGWIARAARAGVRLTAWEKVVLVTTLYYVEREVSFDLFAARPRRGRASVERVPA